MKLSNTTIANNGIKTNLFPLLIVPVSNKITKNFMRI